MIIEVDAKENCSDCIFSEEFIWCGLRDGDRIIFDEESYGMPDKDFCPLLNSKIEITDKIKVLKR